MNARVLCFQAFFCGIQCWCLYLYAVHTLMRHKPADEAPQLAAECPPPVVTPTPADNSNHTRTKPWLDMMRHGGMTVAPPKVFWFIATHHGGEPAKRAVMDTWGRRVDLHWFTDWDDPSLGPNRHVVVVPEGESYNNMFFKMMLIWEQVYANHPGYDYYMRLWQDNYVVVDRVLLQLMRWDPHAKPIVVGNVGPFMQDTKAPGSWNFLGGGPGWAVGALGLKVLAERADECRAMVARADNFGACKHACEDVLISWCLRAYDVEFIPSCGWFGHAPENQYSCGIQPRQLACGQRVAIRDCPAGRAGECGTATDYPAIFHYIGPEDMVRLEGVVYGDPEGCR